MKLKFKLGLSYGLMFAFVLITGFVGYYGANRLSQELDYVAGPAWSAADGAMEGSIEVEAQIIALERIFQRINVQDNMARLAESSRGAEESLGRMIRSGLIREELISQLSHIKNEFDSNRDQILRLVHSDSNYQNSPAFKNLRQQYYGNSSRFLAFLSELEEIGDSKVESEGEVISGIKKQVQSIILWTLVLSLGIGIFVYWILSNSILNPVGKIIQASQEISAGNLNFQQVEVNTRDEMSLLAQNFNQLSLELRHYLEHGRNIIQGKLGKREFGLNGDFEDSLRIMYDQAQARLEAEQREKEAADRLLDQANDKLKMEQREREASEKMRTVLERVAASAEGLTEASGQMTTTSQQMAGNAEETSSQANVVSSASEQINQNIQEVSTGAQELEASIREIAQNANQAAQVTAEAVKIAESTNKAISRLGDSSSEIGEVIKMITSIAEQTNLLALNATIEAARAGEAGKGFAVVANEVKELANQTAQATEDIDKKIKNIQENSFGAVMEIGKITAIINQINDISNSIASSVEEQTATTSEMARTVDKVSKGTENIISNMAGVASATRNTAEGATQTQQAASHLARLANELQGIVSQFRI